MCASLPIRGQSQIQRAGRIGSGPVPIRYPGGTDRSIDTQTFADSYLNFVD